MGVAICHADAICVNTVGQYDCQCEEGYTGDGYTCTGEYSYDMGTSVLVASTVMISVLVYC